MSAFVHARRAVEALRSGVPNRDAVRALGSAQPHVEAQFREQLRAAKALLVGSGGATDAAETPASGLLIAGDFGAGKSHLLEHLRHIALEERFVCSTVVISKETPLHDPAKLYRAAIETAAAPDRKGPALAEIASQLDFGSPRYRDFSRWAHHAAAAGAGEAGGGATIAASGPGSAGPGGALSSRFPASLYLYERVKDAEVQDRIVSFWAGDPLNVSDIRRWLRIHGEAATYPLERVPSKELPLHRFRFTPRLMVAAGYAGWVLLIDEVELIARYSFMQRARSYAALARWTGRLHGLQGLQGVEDEAFPGLTTVCAITSDFAPAVLEERNDAETIPGKLRGSGLEAERLLASQAERGMRLIAREAVHLRPPDRTMVDRARQQVRALHAEAYGWEPPPLRPEEYLSTTSMRQHVRRWINEWDLRRLDPSYTGETLVMEDVRPDYTEEPALEVPSEGESKPDARA